ncbi:hypothetical protein LPB22_10705 [Staphylococcus aureus]
MKLNEINKVIKKVSEELTNINKKYNTDINIFFEDNGSYNHVLFSYLVKSRLLCKMLYNVFTISTYQN